MVAVYVAERMRLQDSQLYKDLLGGPAAETNAMRWGLFRTVNQMKLATGYI